MTKFLDLSFKNNIVPLALLLCSISCLATIFWPGFMSPDSIMQLNQGLEGNYSDHHPPMMSFVWRIFSVVHSGTQSYLIFHLLLLFCAAYILQSIIQPFWLKIAVALIPLIPNISAYSGALWKDIGFAYSFLLAAMILLSISLGKDKRSYSKIVGIILLLVYGVGVKYQAKFVLPIMVLWLSIICTKNFWRAAVLAVVTTVGLLFLVSSFNKALVPVEKENHSWQLVKLYDIAGISVRTNENLFPEYVKNYENFSIEEVTTIYSPYRVDELVASFFPTAPLPVAKNGMEREILWNRWAELVLKYPSAYAAHRFAIWLEMVNKSPIKRVEQLKSADSLPYVVKLILESSGSGLFKLVYESSKFILIFPFMLIFIASGIVWLKKGNKYGLPLLMMNLAGLSLLSCLFVFSMAAELRYIYLTTCLTIFSFPVFIMALQEKSD